jgi:hypothetical protein
MYHLTLKSSNAKTGPIPVSTSTAATCPDVCPFKRGGGCYADGGPLAIHWKAVTNGERGADWRGFLKSLAAIPVGALWRMNQAGDLPGTGDSLNRQALAQLVQAQRGKRGFTYTHKPLTSAADRAAIAAANASGFTINLSANDLSHADALADLGIGPVAVVLESSQTSNLATPAGRKVVVCPATIRDDVTCATCQACANASRSVIIGFPAHGASKRKASIIANRRA